MPIEPPDPLTPQAFLDAVSNPALRWANNHVIDTADNDKPYFFAVLDGAWFLKESSSEDTYAISEASFATLVGAKDPQPDGEYTAASGSRWSLHPSRGWAVATPVPRSA